MITRFIKKKKDDYEEELQESWEKKRKARRKNVALEHSQWESQIIIITKIFTNIFQKVLPKWMSYKLNKIEFCYGAYLFMQSTVAEANRYFIISFVL